MKFSFDSSVLGFQIRSHAIPQVGLNLMFIVKIVWEVQSSCFHFPSTDLQEFSMSGTESVKRGDFNAKWFCYN